MRRSARVTVEQLAQHLGLSKFSVSRALAGKDGVSDETRARVRRAAARLGYGNATIDPPPSRQILFVMQDRDRQCHHPNGRSG
jgi:LacI family transcriptional regulator